MLPARLDDYEREQDPHRYGLSQVRSNRLGGSLFRPRDVGVQGDQWRNILLDQFRRRGANFFQV